MALKYIPLPQFVDRSDRLRPKGFIRAADADGPFGLTSAMRNPMAESAYAPYLQVDFRPRDNWTISRDTEEIRSAVLFVVNPTTFGYLRCDNDGVYVNDAIAAPSSPIALMQVTNEDTNGLFSLERDTPSVAVMLAAIRVKSTTPSTTGTLVHSPLGYYKQTERALHGELLHNTGTGSFQAALYSRGAQGSASTVEPFPVPNATDSIINADSLGKWIFIQVVKDGANAVTVRLAGGQFPPGLPLASALSIPFNPVPAPGYDPIQVWATDRFRVPIRLHSEARLGFATLARYDANSPGAPGTGDGVLQWQLFDAIHLCGSYSISANQWEFKCTNQISWRAQRSGVWYAQEGNGVWVPEDQVQLEKRYGSGIYTVDLLNTEALRPVFWNTGLLNSETLGILEWVRAGIP